MEMIRCDRLDCFVIYSRVEGMITDHGEAFLGQRTLILHDVVQILSRIYARQFGGRVSMLFNVLRHVPN